MKRKRPIGRFPRRPRKLDKNYKEKSEAELQKLLTKEKLSKTPAKVVQDSISIHSSKL